MKRFLSILLGLSLLCGAAGAENMKYRKLNTDSVVEGTNQYYTDARARAAISSTATGLTYTGATGVFSLTSGYAIPATNVIWPIANGGTNASSFAQSNGLLYYNGTSLVADIPALTSTYLPVATTSGRLTNSVLIQDATSDISNSASNIIYASASLTAAQMNALIAASSGKTIVLGAGTYAFSSSLISCGVPVTIRGQGVDATNLTWTNAVALDIATSNVKFENITLSMTTSGSTNRYLINCTTDGVSGFDLTNVNINVSGSNSGINSGLIYSKPFGGTWRNVKFNITSTGGDTWSMMSSNFSGTAQTLNMYGCDISAIQSVGNSDSYALWHKDNSSAGAFTINAYDSNFTASESGSGDGNAVRTSGSASAIFNGYRCRLSGTQNDANGGATAPLTLSNCTLANGTTSGTITYAGGIVSKNLGLGTASVGTSGKNVFSAFTGTAPTTSPADCYQTYSADVGGVAGQAGMHVKSELGGVAAFNSALGTLNTYTYQKDDLADDGTVTLPDATSGMVIVTCNAESGLFHVQTDGTVTKIAGSTNTAATDSDGNLCVYDGGTGGIVKNRLAATGETRIVYYYN